QGSQARQPTKHFFPLTQGVMAVSLRGFRHRVRNTLSASPVLPFLTSSISTNIHIYGFNQMGISF
ncbi:TPA: hypothetical protein ACXIIK_003604, partial [Clostridioides difficile]